MTSSRSNSRRGRIVGLLMGTLGLLATAAPIAFAPAATAATTASAEPTQLCYSTTYTCDQQYGNTGYAGQTVWGFPGAPGTPHNCTTYVAWRLQQNGMARPPFKLGNATDWATNAAKNGVLVNGIPAVGSIAQWYSDTNWASDSSGHVGYVVAVSSGAITVVSDNYPFTSANTGIYYPGHMDTYSFPVGSPDWPNNFIHFNDVSPSSAPASDLVYQDPGSATIYMLANIGSGVSLSTVVSGWAQPAWEVAGDFLGNGHDQLVYQDPGSATIYMLANIGSGVSLSTVVSGWAQPAWEIPAAA